MIYEGCAGNVPIQFHFVRVVTLGIFCGAHSKEQEYGVFVVSDGCMVLVENERNDQPQGVLR